MKYILVLFFTSVCSLIVNLSKAQTAAADNKLSQSITSHTIPGGQSLYGIFEGRPPCEEIARQVDSTVTSECPKVKWRLMFFRDPVTKKPSMYQVLGRFLPAQGKWKIIKGIKSNPDAEVFQLELGKPGLYFYFLKGDENVLFVLDENKEFRVGNENFSYTLNRVELLPKK